MLKEAESGAALVGKGSEQVSQLLVSHSGRQQLAAEDLPHAGPVPGIRRCQPRDELCHLHSSFACLLLPK